MQCIDSWIAGSSNKHGEIVYAARPSRATGAFGGVVRWDVLEFIARVTDHVPEPGQQLIRYYVPRGFMGSTACNGLILKTSNRFCVP